MTPREIMGQADLKADRAAYDALVSELGPPAGWITVNARPMAYWMPEGVPPLPGLLAPGEELDIEFANRIHAPVGHWATEGATENQQVPF